MLAIRRYNRTALRSPLEFTQADPRHVTFGFARDISVGGIAVATDFPAPLGSEVFLRLWLPGAPDEAVLPGIVRWLSPSGMGVQFLSLEPEVAGLIARIAELVAGVDPSTSSENRESTTGTVVPFRQTA